MPNMASILKEDMARVARKEVRSETVKLKKTSSQYRAEIAVLKRRVATLEQLVSRLHSNLGKGVAAPPENPIAIPRVRISPKGVSSQRHRLGLTAAGMGALLGVSPQTVYNWEAGSTHPRRQQLMAIAELRSLGKKAVSSRLQSLAA